MWCRRLYCEAFKIVHQSLLCSAKEDSGERLVSPEAGTIGRQVESHTHECSSPKQEQIKLALSIVPVRVRAKGKTAYQYKHVSPDPRSTKTFCSEALVEKPDVKGGQAYLFLTTVSCNESTDAELGAWEVVVARSEEVKPGII